MKCRERMEQYLRENSVGFEVMAHSQAFTMQEVAAALHVPGDQVAKVVIVCADDKKAMLVLPAPYRLNTEKARALLGAKKARLAKEDEFADLFPDCATGAMPPFGNLWNLPVYAASALGDNKLIAFNAGTHRQVVQLAYEDFLRLVKPQVLDFATVPA